MANSKDGSKRPRRPATDLLHRGRTPSAQHGFVNPPVYRGSTVLFPTVEKLEAYDEQPYKYGRHGTPTTSALEEALAHLEGGARTFLTASGYQAVTTAILAFVEAGDHILVADSVYQPTRRFADYLLKRLGIATTYYDPLVGAGIADLIDDKTRLIFTESPGSLTFEMQDIPAIAAVAKSRGAWLLMDNTWATPLYYNALAAGADVSIQAATKYIVGHADAMLGAITVNDRALRHVERAKTALGSAPARRRPISRFAACARWTCASSVTSARPSRWRAGSHPVPRSPASSIPPCRRTPATRCGSATTRVRAVSSR